MSQGRGQRKNRPATGTLETPSDVEFQRFRQLRKDELWGKLAHRALNWVGVLGLGAIFWLVVKEVAGKTTVMQVVVDALASLKINQWLAWILAIAAVGGNLYQLRARRKLIERYHPDRRKYEQTLDPERTSSAGRLGAD